MHEKILFAVVGVLLLTGCYHESPDPYYLLSIQNNSSFDIISYQATGDESQLTVYPDTLLPDIFYVKTWANGERDIIEATDSSMLILPGQTFPIFENYYWEKMNKWVFNRYFKDGIYSVFIFSYDTVKKKGWEGIRDDYDILVRYDLTYDDLKLLKDTIPFPPTDVMKDMKMYPPYGGVVKKYR